MLKALLVSTALLAVTPVYAFDFPPIPEVYPGCSVPTISGKTWWVSPTGNDSTGDGTESKPWTLKSITNSGTWGSPRFNNYPYQHRDPISKALVFSPNPDAPIHAGDVIILMPGNYGGLLLGIYGQDINNSDWLTFVSASNAVFSKISIVNPINKIRISGVLVRNDGVATGALIDLRGKSNLIIDHTDIANVDDNVSSTYQLPDWETSITRGGIAINNANCITASNNKIHNIRVGAAISNVLQGNFKDNEISYFTRDAIDVGANDFNVLNNFIHDVIVSSTNHMDAIQGFGPSMDGSANQYSNGKYQHLVIDSNRIFRQLDANNKFATALQGIDSFDGDWTNIQITRNVVVTSACWAISWGSTHYGLFAQNTAIWDGSLAGVNNAAGNKMCEPALAPFTATHEYPAGDHVVAINNISSMGTFGPIADGSIATNNLFATAPFSYIDTSTGKIVYQTKQGLFLGNTFMANSAMPGVFVNLGRNPQGIGPFDLNIADGSPAIRSGISTIPQLADIQLAYPNLVLPTVDITGRPYDHLHPTLGAYAYQPPKICTPDTTSCIQPPPPPPICTTIPGICNLPSTQ